MTASDAKRHWEEEYERARRRDADFETISAKLLSAPWHCRTPVHGANVDWWMLYHLATTKPPSPLLAIDTRK